jgi:hypothetical protein
MVCLFPYIQFPFLLGLIVVVFTIVTVLLIVNEFVYRLLPFPAPLRHSSLRNLTSTADLVAVLAVAADSAVDLAVDSAGWASRARGLRARSFWTDNGHFISPNASNYISNCYIVFI